MKYFLNGLYVDLGDLHSNARDGVHVAAAGGVWASLIYGFAGLRDHDGEISFDPRLPADWDAMTFPLQVRGSRLRVRLEPSSIGFSLEVGEPVGVTVRGERVVVEGEGPVNVQLDGQGERLESLKGSHPIVGLRRADGSVVRSVLPEV